MVKVKVLKAKVKNANLGIIIIGILADIILIINAWHHW